MMLRKHISTAVQGTVTGLSVKLCEERHPSKLSESQEGDMGIPCTLPITPNLVWARGIHVNRQKIKGLSTFLSYYISPQLFGKYLSPSKQRRLKFKYSHYIYIHILKYIFVCYVCDTHMRTYVSECLRKLMLRLEQDVWCGLPVSVSLSWEGLSHWASGGYSQAGQWALGSALSLSL